MCYHLEDQNLLKQSLLNKFIYKDECTLCFHNSCMENGINLCLLCFNGSCSGNELRNKTDHTKLHLKKTSHKIFLNIKKIIEKVEQPKEEINKIALNTEGGIIDLEITSFIYKVFCAECDKLEDVPEDYKNLVKSIEEHESAYKRATLEAWELELKTCQHSNNISQLNKNSTPNQILELDKCLDCEMKSNLWLCLECGNIGCGRKNYDGTGGNNHGIDHYEKTNHSISVKIGTLCSNQNPSCYCYICDDEVNVKNIKNVISKFGLDLDRMQKTEKTINELSLEYNLNFKLSENFEKTENLKKIKNDFKPHGLENIGNSCYLNSVIQNLVGYEKINLFCIHSNETAFKHLLNCEIFPAECFVCQLIKLVSVLKENEYLGLDYQIKPFMFRYLVGKEHLEFRTQKQQDACEYLIHLFSFLRKAEEHLKVDFTNQFNFITVTKFECPDCGCFYERENTTNIFNFKLDDNQIQEVIENWDENINNPYEIDFFKVLQKGIPAEDSVLDCKICSKKKVFNGKLFIKKFPKYLMIKVENFTLHQFQALKLQFKLLFNDDSLDLAILDINNQNLDTQKKIQFENKEAEFNQEAIELFTNMGFSLNRSKRALLEAGQNTENALNILMANADNPDYDKALVQKTSQNVEFFPNVWDLVGSLGLDEKYVQKVCFNFKDKGPEFCVNYIFDTPFDIGILKEIEVEDTLVNNNNEIEDNGNRLYEVIGGVVHLGKSVHVGHYVGFTKRIVEGNKKWVYFNDDKVFESEKPKIGQSYILFLERKDHLFFN